MRMPPCLIATLIWLALLAGASRAEDDAQIEARWARLRMGTVQRLHELADWCRGAKLFAFRAEIYEEILVLDPNDPTARKWLRYKLDSDGHWVRKSKYKKPKNMGDGLEAYAERRARVGQWYAEKAEPLVGDAEEAGQGRLIWHIAALGLQVDADNATFREWNGEVRQPGGGVSDWILVESQRSRERRPRLKKTAEDAVAAVPSPQPETLTDADRVGGVKWQDVLQGERVRVVGIPGTDELEQVLRNADAAWPLFKRAFGFKADLMPSGMQYGRGITIYVADGPRAGNRFLAAEANADPRRLKFMQPLAAVWLQKQPVVLLKSALPLVRLEGAARLVLQGMLYRQLGLGPHRAWAQEALAIYLTWQITGTRFLSSVTDVETRYGEAERDLPEYEKEISERDADWLALGRKLVESPDKPDFFLLAGKHLNLLSSAEVLYAHSVVAYVVEGHPERAAALFRALGEESGSDLERVCLDALGFDVRTLESRVRRWLLETTAGTDAEESEPKRD